MWQELNVIESTNEKNFKIQIKLIIPGLKKECETKY
jgi:hypothetical protein